MQQCFWDRIQGIDLGQDSVAKEVLNIGVKFWSERTECLKKTGFNIYLRWGDPATFTEDRFNAKTEALRYRQITTAYPRAVDSQFFDRGKRLWHYDNAEKVKQDRIARVERTAEQKKEMEALAAQKAAAEQLAKQKEQSEIAARSAAFVKTFGVTHFVTAEQLNANPFVYQGQVVAVYAVFLQMNSATDGLFSSSGPTDALLVSAIPSGKFTQSNVMTMLAARVLGKQEIKLPILGPTLVPHLSFVGSAFCQKQRCADYAINLK